jgi:hypothetical protein
MSGWGGYRLVQDLSIGCVKHGVAHEDHHESTRNNELPSVGLEAALLPEGGHEDKWETS